MKSLFTLGMGLAIVAYLATKMSALHHEPGVSIAAAQGIAAPAALHEPNWAYYFPAGGTNATNQFMSPVEANDDITYAEGVRAVLDCSSTRQHCASVYYIESTFLYAQGSGKQKPVQEVFDGTCARNGTQPDNIMSAADESFFLHAAGTLPGPNTRLSGTYGKNGELTQMLLNKTSSTYTTYMQEILANCKVGKGTAARPYVYVNSSDFIMWDDTVRTIRNILQAVPTSNRQSTLEYATDVAHVEAQQRFIDAMRHRNGAPFLSFFNGQKDTSTALLATSKNAVGGIYEHAVINSGVEDASTISYIMDICAAVNNQTDKMFVLLGTGGPIAGTPEHLTQRRVFEGVVKLCYKDGQTVSWEDIERASQRWSPEFPEQWLQTEDPLTSMAAPVPADCGPRTCSSHGAHDLCIAGSYPNCVYAREFGHCWYGLSGTNVDEGPCAVVVNLSGNTYTPTLGSFHYRYNHEIELCKPSGGSYFQPVCSGDTGGDIGDSMGGGTDGGGWGTGPGSLDFNFFTWSGNTSVPSGDALWLVGGPR